MNPDLKRIAFRRLLVRMEDLRAASMKLDEDLAVMVALGISVDDVIEAVRIEHTDWPRHLARVQRISTLLDAMGYRTRIDAMFLVDEPIAGEAERAQWEEDEGYLAFCVGRKISECPYERGSAAQISWRNGWVRAKEADKAISS